MPGAIDLSLERLAELSGDPQKEIYSLMYFRYPDYQSLFVLDKDHSVRGAMLQTAFEFLLVYSDKGEVNKGDLASWRSHHLEYGVEEDIFSVFFELIRDCVKDKLGAEWTKGMASHWQDFLVEVGSC
tara:strand:- start:320 stop:700 length:381 start_codon:yes stop_codon:yes gene_type:complete